MIRQSLLLLLVLGLSAGQRSPYLASTPVEYPTLLAKFRPNGTVGGTVGGGGGSGSGTSGSGTSGGGLGDRMGGGGSVVGGGGQGPPVLLNADGTLWDSQTLGWVATWPKEKQPFWFVNRQQIAGHRGTSSSNATR